MQKKINRLWEIIDNEKITVKYKNILTIGERLKGLYLVTNFGPAIILDKSLKRNKREHNCTLLEEVGHHFAGIKTNILFTSRCYATEIERDRDEYRAMVWATNYAITDLELSHAVHEQSLKTCAELAEHFEVTNEFLMKKIIVLKRKLRRRGIRAKGKSVLNFIR
jgi:Zn-dependent peptidase ImmA (M78 family)